MPKPPFVLLVIILTVASCQDAAAPAVRRGIQFISGAGVSDSAAAVLAQSLVLEVHDSTGALAPAGTAVTFTSVSGPIGPVEAWVQSVTSGNFVTFFGGSTNVAGQIGVKVRLGVRAGVARIAVEVPILNLKDTARFTIVPAAATSIVVGPADTALNVDRTFTLRGGVTDAYGNVRNDPVAWSTSGSGLSVSNAGVVSAASIGRYTITGTAGTMTGSGAVSVLPQGRLAAWQAGGIGNIVSLDLDGSNLKVLAPVVDGGIGPHPAWIPGTNSIIYTSYNGTNQVLRTVDQNGAVAQFFTTTPATMTHQAEPTPASATDWVYFSAWDSQCVGDFYCLYRAKRDAASPEVLGSFISTSAESKSPAPSPDGSKVAFSSGGQIRVFDVASKTVSSWSVLGGYAAWSPDGTQIAFVAADGRINLVNPDGGGERALTSGSSYLVRPLSWSPDGKWILARASGLLHVIDAATGAALPVPYSSAFVVANWK